MSHVHTFTYENGQKVRSKVTRFTGTITSLSVHMNGCDRYWLEPEVDKEGRCQDGRWIDEGELEVLPVKKAEVSKAGSGLGGGPSSPIK